MNMFLFIRCRPFFIWISFISTGVTPVVSTIHINAKDMLPCICKNKCVVVFFRNNCCCLNPVPHFIFYSYNGTFHLNRKIRNNVWLAHCMTADDAHTRQRTGSSLGAGNGLSLVLYQAIILHDDVIKWKYFPHYWPFVRGIHRSRWIPRTKASDAELWYFLWSAPA